MGTQPIVDELVALRKELSKLCDEAMALRVQAEEVQGELDEAQEDRELLLGTLGLSEKEWESERLQAESMSPATYLLRRYAALTGRALAEDDVGQLASLVVQLRESVTGLGLALRAGPEG